MRIAEAKDGVLIVASGKVWQHAKCDVLGLQVLTTVSYFNSIDSQTACGHSPPATLHYRRMPPTPNSNHILHDFAGFWYVRDFISIQYVNALNLYVILSLCELTKVRFHAPLLISRSLTLLGNCPLNKCRLLLCVVAFQGVVILDTISEVSTVIVFIYLYT